MRCMRLFEVLNDNHYLGSPPELHHGEITFADLHMDVHPRHHGVEVILERARPSNCLSRSSCVFLADSQRGVKLLGMPLDHVCEARPIGNVERSDLNWWKMIAEAVARPQKELRVLRIGHSSIGPAQNIRRMFRCRNIEQKL